eukprot:14510846-Ditylum_brightwellii.AAC.1
MEREGDGGVCICMTVSCNTVFLAIACSIASLPSSSSFDLSPLLGVTTLVGYVAGETERDD